MAKAAADYTPTDDEWTVDDAFRYLTRAICRRDDHAIYDLTEKVLTGELPITASRFVNGTLISTGTVPAPFWREYFVLHVIKGKAEVRAIKALEWKWDEYRFTLSSRDIKLFWPPPEITEEVKTVEDWAKIEVTHLRVGNRSISKTDLARLLEKRLKDTVKSNPHSHLRTVGWEYIRNSATAWGIWPLK
jgi:hypothetical protein